MFAFEFLRMPRKEKGEEGQRIVSQQMNRARVWPATEAEAAAGSRFYSACRVCHANIDYIISDYYSTMARTRMRMGINTK